MRWGRLLWVLTLVGMAASAAAKAPPEAIARARHLFENGVIYEHLGQYQQAVDTLTQAIDMRALGGEDAARALFDRGVALDALGRTQRALADYSAALRLAPKLSAAHSNRANVYRRLGRLEAAKREYMAALQCPGVSSQYPYYGLGQIAKQLGDRDTARDYFQKALAVDPSYALAAQSLSALAAPVTVKAVKSASVPAVPQEVRPKLALAHSVSVGVPADTSKGVVGASRATTSASPSLPIRAGVRLRLRRTISDVSDRPHSAATVQVQLGAYRDEHSAAEAWRKISASSAGKVLESLQPIIVIADLPGRGRYWRLRTAVADKQSAHKLCTNLLSSGLACMIVSN